VFSCAHDSLIYPPSLVSVNEPRYVPMDTCFVYHFSWVGFVNCQLGMSYAQKKENGKRRKVEEQNALKKTKDKKDKVEAPTRPVAAVAARVPMPMYTPPPPPIDNDDGISNDAIGGPTGHLFEHNSQIIGQIRANLAACKVNICL
jgi:hypothetical protein